MQLPRTADSVYRPDIDGLRAFAVLAVILFHINPAWLPGGFIGVDVFFVISGYLITGIIARELQSQRFTFRGFYERRIRRILPALWVLLMVCVPVSAWLMLPEDAEPMGKSALWSTLAMANVYFWREVTTDYFAPQSSQFPFLHLWSLGVEEQFYLIWPVLMLLAWRSAGARARVMSCGMAVIIVFASTLLGDWLLATGQSRFAYYMLPTRAGELALGAALALWGTAASARSRVTAGTRCLTAAGWGLLVYSLVCISEAEPFPGWRALLPTVGAGALILCGRIAPGHAGLAPLRWPPALWLGRCSYSAYLWHWPVLAWWRYLWGQPDVFSGLLLLLVILALAEASRRWVEEPARTSRMSFSRTTLLIGALPAVLIASMALLAARGDRWGFPLYTDAQRQAWAELRTHVTPAHHLPWVCQQHVLDRSSLSDPKCESGSGAGAAQVLILGDSHAAEFVPLFRAVAERQGVRFRSIALGSCAPLTGSLAGVVQDWRLQACQDGMPWILSRAADFPRLVVGADWTSYARNDPAVWRRLEAQLVEWSARGQRIWLLPSVPEFKAYDAACPAKRVKVGAWLECPTRLTPTAWKSDANSRLAAIAAKVPGVTFLPFHEALCEGSSCPIADAQGRLLYSDVSHLSTNGAAYLDAALARMGRTPDLANWTYGSR